MRLPTVDSSCAAEGNLCRLLRFAPVMPHPIRCTRCAYARMRKTNCNGILEVEFERMKNVEQGEAKKLLFMIPLRSVEAILLNELILCKNRHPYFSWLKIPLKLSMAFSNLFENWIRNFQSIFAFQSSISSSTFSRTVQGSAEVTSATQVASVGAVNYWQPHPLTASGGAAVLRDFNCQSCHLILLLSKQFEDC